MGKITFEDLKVNNYYDEKHYGMIKLVGKRELYNEKFVTMHYITNSFGTRDIEEHPYHEGVFEFTEINKRRV